MKDDPPGKAAARPAERLAKTQAVFVARAPDG